MKKLDANIGGHRHFCSTTKLNFECWWPPAAPRVQMSKRAKNSKIQYFGVFTKVQVQNLNSCVYLTRLIKYSTFE
jgi:hypothetical protein